MLDRNKLSSARDWAWREIIAVSSTMDGMKGTTEFFEALEQYYEHFDWSAEAVIRELTDIRPAKAILSEGRAFFKKWERFVNIPDAAHLYKEMRRFHDDLERRLGRAWLEALRNAVTVRHDALMSILIHDGLIKILHLEKIIPSELREGFVKAYLGDKPGPFDPEKDYRASEADLEAAEEKARLAFTKLEIDWPEKVDAQFRARWNNLKEAQDTKAWLSEIRAALAAN